MKTQGIVIEAKVNAQPIQLDEEGRGLAAAFSALTIKDILDISIESQHLLISRKNERRWELLTFNRDESSHWRTSLFVDRQQTLATLKSFCQRDDKWLLLAEYNERPRDEVLPPLIKCYICHCVISDSYGECPFCGGVFDDSASKRKPAVRKPVVAPIPALPLTQSHRLPTGQEEAPYHPEKTLAIICGAILGVALCACLCACLWLWWSEGDIKRKVEANRQKSIADAAAAGTFRKDEYENPHAKVNPVGTASELRKIEPHRRSSYVPDGFRSARGRISVGTVLYDVTGKPFGIVTAEKGGEVEVAQANTVEITSSRVSIYGIVHDRENINSKYFVK